MKTEYEELMDRLDAEARHHTEKAQFWGRLSVIFAISAVAFVLVGLL